MNKPDPLERFERLLPLLREDAPPRVHVAPEVMRRIRSVRATSERTLEFLAAGSCVAALLTALAGFSLLSEMSDPLEALFQIVPPIGL